MSQSVFELSESQKNELSAMFADRVNMSKRERHFYNHDVGALPSMVRKFLGKAEPAAIVKLKDEDDVVKLLEFASKYSIPVVPRAGATSGYGGVIPTKGGIIADVGLLDRIYDVDNEAMEATVGAGIVWELLEQRLNKRGFSVCSMPSSAPAATVGGWVAQNGVGYGSYEYGWSQDTILSARVVFPNGEIKEFTGDELSDIVANYGSLGIITQVKLKIRNHENTVAVSASFPDASSMQEAIRLVGERKIPLWSITFINPEFSDLKNKAPARLHHGEPVSEDKPELPDAYVCNFFYPASRKVDGLEDAIVKAGGSILPEEVGEHETGEWFRSMKVKRLGPSFIPAEVVIPADKLGKVISEINKTVSLPVLMEGMVAKGDEVILLCFIPHSEKSFKFNMAFPLAISILRIAEANGGRMYATGLYFAKDAPKVYGDHFRKLMELKKKYDPKDIMNPETLTGRGSFNAAISMSRTFEPMMRIVGNMSGVGDTKFRSEKNIPADVISHAYTCAQCGYCVNQCDQYYGRGWESQSPRGKWFFIKEYLAGRDKMVQEQVDTFLACTTCELCDVRCQLDLPINDSWMTMRNELVVNQGKMTIPPFEIMASSLLKERNIWGEYLKNREEWMPEDLKPKIKDKAEYAYFAGCTASFVEKDIAEASVRLLTDAGIDITYLGKEESCCGIPMLAAGKWDVFEKIMRMNIENMRKKGVKTVVTSCPACWLVWDTFYRQWAEKLGIEYDFEAKHYSQVLQDKLDVLSDKFVKPLDRVVTIHDACHMGRAGGIYEPPRDLIKSVPGVEFREMEHNRENGHCCGSVLTLVADPEVADVVGNIRLKEAEEAGADLMVAACPCCQVQLRIAAESSGSPVEVQDLSATVARSLGYNIPDTTNDALTAWITFDQMIHLLRPENMTDLMVELLPQMMDAMPAPLKPMMKMVKYVPGMDIMMKPMMPIMMPRLLPGMMPKVMPDMLEAVGRRVQMSDDLREQMPDLMPKSMENLMPNMLPQIVPLLTPKMIEYIKTH
ncbi:Fe-S oxidoreductase/FAD/FMN-containing dehydrogenase [Methanohalophilus levihalophilus]|uniref:FAD-binding and (Fe-S)-binding domain-containing protein n=1 Tax=Methanohalophilus levihalophilus TaxID=1431282 RepID=UPI001AE67410|nr:FAD-binding and (Fe-S)-binding domain-containing protein [Methanohalophilus levihalophilus]MBP2030543.1 Fe-S oxidoreductase/FAD/FMN-containing dehydrogenase [Methanohalophilus levihalophilus]